MDASSLAENAEISGTYRLVRLLGQGGMGAVWEAEHMRLPKRVAIKFLLGPGLSNPEILARFRREAEIASRLEHPNIVEVHDYNTLSDGTPYLVMERLQGRDLRARLDEGSVGLDEAQTIVRQVVSALSLAHREGVVHRDLKPENIFLCQQGDGTCRVKVLDFGISKLQDSSTMMTQENTILGTPNYMAPEQAMGQHSRIDGRTDLFSLAAIFYEMLTGETIFRGQTLVEVLYKVTHYTPTPLHERRPDIPAAISAAVATALSKDPGSRQLSVLQFVTSFDAGAESEAVSSDKRVMAPAVGGTVVADSRGGRVPTSPLHASEHPPVAPTRPSAGKGAAGFIIAGLLLAAGGTGAYVFLKRDPSPQDTSAVAASEAANAESAASGSPDSPSANAGTSPEEGSPSAAAGNSAITDKPPAAGGTPAATGHPAAAAGNRSESGSPSATGMPSAGADEPSAATGTAPDIDAPTQGAASETTGAPDRADDDGEVVGSGASKQPPERDRPRSGGSSRPLPPLLQEASTALGRNDFAEALRLAKRSLQDGKHPQAYVVLTKAYCGKRDIGLANAMARNLNTSGRRQAKTYCKKHGIELP